MSDAPGVIITYQPSRSLSISSGGAMSVPALIGPFRPRETDATCVRVDSWADFKSAFHVDDDWIPLVTVISKAPVTDPPEEPTSSGKRSTKTQEGEWEYSVSLADDFATPSPTPSIKSIRSVELYFLNGGASAYIIPVPSAKPPQKKARNKSAQPSGDDEEALALLPSIVLGEPEISLLVWCGEQDSKSSVYGALAELISGDNLPYFLLTDVADGNEAPVVTENASVGVWSPHILTQWQPQLPADVNIRVVGYEDDDGKQSITLDELRSINQALYDEIKQAVQESVGNRKMAEQTLTLSPTPLVAAQFALVEKQRGIWWSPAGMDVTLQGLSGLSVTFSEREHADLNGRGINAIRDFRRPTSGYRVFGARTQQRDDDWRYINVRRLYQMLMRDIGAAIQKKVFSPNTPSTWTAVSQAISGYLDDLWRRGGLAGTTAAQAYDVKVGKGVTMSASDILNGIMQVDVKFAAVRPTEFVVLRFSQVMGEA